MLRPRDPDIPQGDPVMVERALQAVVNAKRPVIFVGKDKGSGALTYQIIPALVGDI